MMSVVDSEIAYLGSGGVTTGGLSWRVSVFSAVFKRDSRYRGTRQLFGNNSDTSVVVWYA